MKLSHDKPPAEVSTPNKPLSDIAVDDTLTVPSRWGYKDNTVTITKVANSVYHYIDSSGKFGNNWLSSIEIHDVSYTVPLAPSQVSTPKETTMNHKYNVGDYINIKAAFGWYGNEPVEITKVDNANYYYANSVDSGLSGIDNLDSNPDVYLVQPTQDNSKETTMNSINGNTTVCTPITVTMTAKEYAKYTASTLVENKSDYKARQSFTVVTYNSLGNKRAVHHTKSLKKAKRIENNYLQDAKAGSIVTISKEISANKREPAKMIKA